MHKKDNTLGLNCFPLMLVAKLPCLISTHHPICALRPRCAHSNPGVRLEQVCQHHGFAQQCLGGKPTGLRPLPLCARAPVPLHCAEWAPSIWALAKSSLQVLMGTNIGSSYWGVCFYSFCYKARLTEQSHKEMEMWWYWGTLLSAFPGIQQTILATLELS